MRPKPGDGIRSSTRRYLVTGIEEPKRAGRTLFVVKAIVLGPADPDPMPIYDWRWERSSR